MSQASEAANRSLLFRLLFLVFIAHSHCLPATTTLLCETRAEKKKRFFPKWIWMHDTGKPVGRNPPWQTPSHGCSSPGQASRGCCCQINSWSENLRMEQLQNPLQNLKAMGQWAARSPDRGPVCPALLRHQHQAKKPILMCLSPWYLVRKEDNEDWFYYLCLPKPPKTWNQIRPITG